MYRTVLPNGKTAGWYFGEFPDAGVPEEDYVFVSISLEETDMAKSLLRKGYSFRERNIVMEIPITKFQPSIKSGKKFKLIFVEDWQPGEIFCVAKETFQTDYRFAFGPAPKNEELKNELLYGFITELKRKGDTAATCLYQGEHLDGFNIWSIRKGIGQVLLGAVSDRYRNSGVALLLYSHTIETMKEQGADTLRDVVATSNISSLNFHAILARCTGGVFRFGPCLDCYRKE